MVAVRSASDRALEIVNVALALPRGGETPKSIRLGLLRMLLGRSPESLVIMVNSFLGFWLVQAIYVKPNTRRFSHCWKPKAKLSYRAPAASVVSPIGLTLRLRVIYSEKKRLVHRSFQ